MTEQELDAKLRVVCSVAIIETDVFGCKAYHVKCLTCLQEYRRKNTEQQAVKDAKDHLCRYFMGN